MDNNRNAARAPRRPTSARTWLVGSASMAAVLFGLSGQAAAEEANRAQLTEVVVTAQKREQRLQDVPIAVTAITAETLKANRIVNVMDLSGIAPGLTIRSTGSTGALSFSVRGVNSIGVVPGSDKEVSTYIDGVYLSSTRGAVFDLPDIQRIEVLRGPQGALFGRNATAGAVSIVTRDPTGEFGVRQDFTVGNYAQFRSRTTVDLPAMGAFSAYVSYVHDQRRGDIKNRGAGTLWDFRGARTGLGTRTDIVKSVKYLGNKNSEDVFVALKFAPTDNFHATYKFDRSQNDFSNVGVEPTAYGRAGTLALYGAARGGAILQILDSAVANGTLILPTNTDRPKSVNNWSTMPSYQRTFGHNLTAEWQVAEHLSLKNVASYRENLIQTLSIQDGFGGLVINAATPAPLNQPGSRFITSTSNNIAIFKQYSDELQANYESKFMVLTMGAIYFHSDDVVGPPLDQRTTYSTLVFPVVNGVGIAPLGGSSTNFPKSKSIAAYAQGEFHVTPQLDAVLGYRITQDKKSILFRTGTLFLTSPVNPLVFIPGPGEVDISAKYKKSKPSYLLGLNYRPTDDVLLYGKYSTAFVSGGVVANLPFAPETVRSWEGGVKADLFDNTVRTNLVLWDAKYAHLQSPQGGQNIGRPDLSTVILDVGGLKSHGAEFEATAAPMVGLSVGGSLSYTHTRFTNPPAFVVASVGGDYTTTYVPKWTSSLFAQYETPVAGDLTLVLRTDATWRSKYRLDANPTVELIEPAFAPFKFSPSAWVVNGRAAIQGIKVGAAEVEVALWARNIFNDKSPLYGWTVRQSTRGISQFQPARTVGADLSLKF